MDIVIFGTNEVASLAHYYLRNDGLENPIAFCVDGKYLKESSVEGLPVIAFEEIEKIHSPVSHKFFAPLYENKFRRDKTAQIARKGYDFISYVSPNAVVHGKLGKNCFIMENNVIQPFVTVGDNVIMWSGNHIGHHSIIGSNVFFSSHVVLSGKCTVEDYCWFGVNSAIRDGIHIAEGTLIGMGSVVVENTNSYCSYLGNPAKVFKPKAE